MNKTKNKINGLGCLQNLRSLYRNGLDKQGRPIMFIKPSYNDNTVEYRLKALIYSLEETIESMDVRNGIEKMCMIADFDTESKLTKKSPDQTTVAKSFLGFLQNHYPERLGICFALNPPWYIRILWTIISPFMDPVTRKKIHFVNGDHAHMKKILLQYIDEDQLESGYGGGRKMEPDEDVRHQRQEAEKAKSSDQDGKSNGSTPAQTNDNAQASSSPPPPATEEETAATSSANAEAAPAEKIKQKKKQKKHKKKQPSSADQSISGEEAGTDDGDE